MGPFLEQDGIIIDSFKKAKKLSQQYESVFSYHIEKMQNLNVNQLFSISSHEDDDIPEVLKIALVIPVQNGGSRAKPVQYRSISLL